MNPVARVRFTLARRPWIRWISVVILAAVAAQIIRNTDADLDRARAGWADTQVVLVTSADHRPGDVLTATPKELPVVAVPPGAIDFLPPSTRARWRVTEGQVLVQAHLARVEGPTAFADIGEVVVGVPTTGSAQPPVGSRVRVVGEGIVLADSGTVAGRADGTVWVAVPESTAATIADGARRNLVSLVLVP